MADLGEVETIGRAIDLEKGSEWSDISVRRQEWLKRLCFLSYEESKKYYRMISPIRLKIEEGTISWQAEAIKLVSSVNAGRGA